MCITQRKIISLALQFSLRRPVDRLVLESPCRRSSYDCTVYSQRIQFICVAHFNNKAVQRDLCPKNTKIQETPHSQQLRNLTNMTFYGVSTWNMLVNVSFSSFRLAGSDPAAVALSAAAFLENQYSSFVAINQIKCKYNQFQQSCKHSGVIFVSTPQFCRINKSWECSACFWLVSFCFP